MADALARAQGYHENHRDQSYDQRGRCEQPDERSASRRWRRDGGDARGDRRLFGEQMLDLGLGAGAPPVLFVQRQGGLASRLRRELGVLGVADRAAKSFEVQLVQ